MDSGREAFPNDIEELKAALAAARDARIAAVAKAAHAVGTRGGQSQDLR
jgi:hypothetical protein